MASTDTIRSSKTETAPPRDRDWKPSREAALGGSNASQQPSELGVSSGGSLRARISDKEAPRSLGPAPPNSYRPEPPQKDDDRDSRKRTVSDREKDASESASGPVVETFAQPPKRPRINRNRYPIVHAAYKLLDAQTGEKARAGRKD